nr:pollen-specific leucine-rich repeat extensin-like protein 4 [Ipomoea batatas]GMD37795.1 pollen-specific leucine-rich repeat extensin-like protein 4 [Ipomoea batatas]
MEHRSSWSSVILYSIAILIISCGFFFQSSYAVQTCYSKSVTQVGSEGERVTEYYTSCSTSHGSGPAPSSGGNPPTPSRPNGPIVPPAPILQPPPVFQPAPLFPPAPILRPGPLFPSPPVFQPGPIFPPPTTPPFPGGN